LREGLLHVTDIRWSDVLPHHHQNRSEAIAREGRKMEDRRFPHTY
jgi:hypothetical protein